MKREQQTTIDGERECNQLQMKIARRRLWDGVTSSVASFVINELWLLFPLNGRTKFAFDMLIYIDVFEALLHFTRLSAQTEGSKTLAVCANYHIFT